ncbi:unnamed protein product [Caenorhabditis angaria]|uniref:Secreted protein n=1 Tax=Caenorhabditis angaria TaxID=860376 RepID=A0A9P1IYM7_9PELO|nr:unnamed protein product [Caenorhabditis angaria]
MWTVFVLVSLYGPAFGSILMPHTIYSTRTFVGNMEPIGSVIAADSAADEIPVVVATQHNRNCFFTPVQCMLPLADTHKDVQTLHGVYQPSLPVRRSAPWSSSPYQKRTQNNRFFEWLSR